MLARLSTAEHIASRDYPHSAQTLPCPIYWCCSAMVPNARAAKLQNVYCRWLITLFQLLKINKHH